jgi:glycosyltransferase involved in cell wall biosynthesis
MKDVSPHLVAILSIWPETYCYTFDEALACGIPVISTPLGAPAERLVQYGCGWLLDSLSVNGFLEGLQRVVDNWEEYCAVCRRIPAITLNKVDDFARRYHEFYRENCGTGKMAVSDRLSSIERQFGGEAGRRRLSWPQLAGRVLNVGLATLKALNVRRLVETFARRVLPTSARRRIYEMRQFNH